MKTPRILTASAAALLTLPFTAAAIDRVWVANPGDGVWGNAANWNANGVPVSGAGDRIFVHTPGSVTGVALDADVLYMGVGTAGAPASGFTFGVGTYNLNAIFIGEGHIGNGHSPGPVNNNYGRAFITAGTTVNVGAFHLGEWDGGSGHVIQSGGDVNISHQFRLGHWPQAGSATNSYTMGGGTITMTAAPGNPLAENVSGNFILGVDSSGTFHMNAGTFTVHGVTMQTRGAGGGQSVFNMNGGLLNVGVNGFVTSNPGVLTSYDINLGGGTIRSTANWSSNLEMHAVAGTGVVFDTNGFNATLSGALDGAGGLSKAGAGTLALGGAASYNGTTSVSAGKLQLLPAGTLVNSPLVFTGASQLQIDAGGKTLHSVSIGAGTSYTLPAFTGQTTTITNALTFTGAPNFTVFPILNAAPTVGQTFDLFSAGSIVGTAGTIITDFGLSHAQGTTTVVGNKLVLTIDVAAAALTWNNAAATGVWNLNGDVNFAGADGKFLNQDSVTFTNTAAGTVQIDGTLLPSVVMVNASANYDFTGAGKLSGPMALNQNGTGTTTISSFHDYSGGTVVNNGVLFLNAQVGGTSGIRGTVTVNALGELRGSGATGATFGYTPGEKIDVFNINGGLVSTVGGVNHVWQAAVNMTAGELRVNNGVSTLTGDYYEWGGSTLNTLASTSTAIVSGRLRIRADAGANFNVNVADGAAATDLLISAGLTSQGGNINLIKNGAGVALLTGGSTLGGVIRVNAGALTLSGTTPYAGNQILLIGDASLTLDGGAAVTVATLETGVNGTNDTLGGTINVGPGTALTVNNNFTFGNTAGGGAISHGIINQTGGTVTVNAPNTDGRNFVLGHWGTGQGTYHLSSGTLNSPGISMAVSWDGEGAFNLSGSGVANVLGLRFGHNPGRSGVFNLTGGTLNLGAEGIWEQTAGFPNDINLGGGTIVAAVSTSIFLPAELTGTNGNVTFDTNGNTLTATGALSGAGGFVKTGVGRMVLNAANNAAGPFVVNGGTLAVQGAHTANRIPANGLVQVNSGGTFEFASVNAAAFNANYVIAAGGTLTNAAGVDHGHVGTVQLNGGTWTTDPGAIAYDGENWQIDGGVVTVGGTVPSLITQQGGTAADRGVAWSGVTTFTVADVTGSAADDLVIATELENTDGGPGQMIKAGAGTMNLTFANSYGGGTFVNAGTLRVNNTTGSGTGAGSITVAAGATLGGAGTAGAGGGITAAISGAIAPGNSVGTLTLNVTTGALVLDGTAQLQFELATPGIIGGSTNDLLTLSGALTLDGTLQVTELPGFGNGTYRLIDYTGALTNNTLDLEAGFLTAHPGSFIDVGTANQVNLVVIPEPATPLAFLAAAGLLGLRRRRGIQTHY